MTHDEIIEMMLEAELLQYGIHMNNLKAFANLVAAKATEEANARANASWTLMCEKMVAFEREACAKVCAEDGAQAMDFTYGTLVGDYFAEIIRARGEA
jgi:hypothetical protein